MPTNRAQTVERLAMAIREEQGYLVDWEQAPETTKNRHLRAGLTITLKPKRRASGK